MFTTNQKSICRRLAFELGLCLIILGFVFASAIVLPLLLGSLLASISVLLIANASQSIIHDIPKRLFKETNRLLEWINRAIYRRLRRAIHQLRFPQWTLSPQDLANAVLVHLTRNLVVVHNPPVYYRWTGSEDNENGDGSDGEGGSSWISLMEFSPTRSFSSTTTITDTDTADSQDHCDCPCCRLETTCNRCLFARQNPSLVEADHFFLSDAGFIRSVHAKVKEKYPRGEMLDWFEVPVPCPEKSPPHCRHFLWDTICTHRVKTWPKRRATRLFQGPIPFKRAAKLAASLASHIVPASPVTDSLALSTAGNKSMRESPQRSMEVVQMDIDGEMVPWSERIVSSPDEWALVEGAKSWKRILPRWQGLKSLSRRKYRGEDRTVGHLRSDCTGRDTWTINLGFRCLACPGMRMHAGFLYPDIC